MKESINKAIEILNSGGVVAIPTETVYGLAAAINNEVGIKNIFATKERPFFDPLIIHIENIEQAKSLTTKWDDLAQIFADRFWPGPLTMILPKTEIVSDLITSGLDTVGIRMPAHPLALNLIKELGTPLAAPSANKFKKTSPTKYSHVRDEFPNVYTLDGDDSEIGIESTIISFTKKSVQILRPGMISKELIEKTLIDNGIENMNIEYAESPVAPGHLKHHYMPNIPIIFKVIDQEYNLEDIPEEILSNTATWNLPNDPLEAARLLYSQFRILEKQGKKSITIQITSKQIKDDHFQGVINRLIKASTYFLPKNYSNKTEVLNN